MAKWLNAVLGGPCTFTVYRDTVEVSDLAAIGASLTTANGVVILSTPGAESHVWEVVVMPTYLTSPTKFRQKSYSFSGSPGLTSAQGRIWLNGAAVQNIPLTTVNPVTPDPATFTNFANASTLHLDEV